jgi:hypothetical protein
MLLDAEFKLTAKGDHAGLQVMLGILGYGIAFGLRQRHFETNTWVNYVCDSLAAFGITVYYSILICWQKKVLTVLAAVLITL